MAVVGGVRVARLGERHGDVHGAETHSAAPFQHRGGVRADAGHDERDAFLRAKRRPVRQQRARHLVAADAPLQEYNEILSPTWIVREKPGDAPFLFIRIYAAGTDFDSVPAAWY